VLTNGTSAPVLNALLRGLPLAVAPNGSEQPLLSQACVRAGVAVYAGERAGAGDPAAVLRRAWQDPGLRHRAQQLGHRLTASGGARQAADIVEAAAGGVRHGTGTALAGTALADAG
jgi:UDP:flavonoid glycosyltransferase YjiC (YdhE family)